MVLKLETAEVVASSKHLSFCLGPTKLQITHPFACEVTHKWSLDNPELLVHHIVGLYHSHKVQRWLTLAESASGLNQRRFRQLAMSAIVGSKVQDGYHTRDVRVEVEGRAEVNTRYGSLQVRGYARLSQRSGTGSATLYPSRGVWNVSATAMYVSAGYEILIQRVSSIVNTSTCPSDVIRVNDIEGLRKVISSMRVGIVWIPAFLAQRQVMLFWRYL
ncbi:hypothetical protein DRO59_00995 [Candidatus Bathyarchaeota archaeon]|nr:MAG: hypothetical protein DRO59_00995 [Candidatus Bathyarchaeota archaeon]